VRCNVRNAVVIALAILSLSVLKAAVAVDATTAWNTYASNYHFAAYPQGQATTFMQAYSGTDLPGDFAAIKAIVGGAVQSSGGAVGYGDVLNESLEDWR
jgi:hypothetical protein